MSLRCQVLWMFRQKAKLKGVGFRHSTDDERDILGRMGYKTGYQVDSFFKRPDQYEPHALFDGKVYVGGKDLHRRDKVVEIGKMLAQGFQNAPIARLVGVDTETVGTIRKAIDAYRGEFFSCKCGRQGGHPAICKKMELSK